MAPRTSVSKSMVQLLEGSRIFQDYKRAFTGSTGLQLDLQGMQSYGAHVYSPKGKTPFCALLARSNQSCQACLAMQKKLEAEAGVAAKTLRCFAGMCETAVPVRVGERTIAFLHTGQVLLHEPNHTEFSRTAQQLIQWGSDVDLKQLEEAYFQSRVLDQKRYEAIIGLVNIFATHLSVISNQLLLQKREAIPPVVRRAQEYIDTHQSENFGLQEVAKAVNTSAFYFCKVFKQATGLTFTEYLARLRVEKARNLLLNPNLRISEIAYQVGFQSLSQFNRTFLRIAGESPTRFREKLPKIT